MKEHILYMEGKIGRPFPQEWPLFLGQKMQGRPLKKSSLGDMVKRLAKNAGIERWRDVYPHCLRKAFENAVRNSGLDWKDQEIMMGHVLPGSMNTYLDKTRIEEFREKFRNVRFFPEGTVTRNEMLDAMRREILALAGYTEEETKKMGDLSIAVGENLFDLFRESGCKLASTESSVCSAQIADGTGLRVLHPLRMVKVVEARALDSNF